MNSSSLAAVSYINYRQCFVCSSPFVSVIVFGIRYEDFRQPNPVHAQQHPHCCYAMTVRHPLMVVAGTADRIVIVFSLQSEQTKESLNQTRSVAAFLNSEASCSRNCSTTSSFRGCNSNTTARRH